MQSSHEKRPRKRKSATKRRSGSIPANRPVPPLRSNRRRAAVQKRIPESSSRRLFQFKITLLGTNPVVWRRIQVWDDTLDKLHEHIQIAMGWSNSHLHHFYIQGVRYGDPELINDGFEPSDALDSTTTLISDVLPTDGSRMAFKYEYDFGDSWLHEVLFEGAPKAQAGVLYPQCLEGARACPPEDVGGAPGFAEFLEAIADPDHERHEECLTWSGPYNPEAFKPSLITHLMQKGLPDWRNEV